MKISLFVFIFLFLIAAYSRLGLNDISILLPLPNSELEKSLLISPNRNNLIPNHVFKLLPVLNPMHDQNVLYNQNLKVIAIRFDPCFESGFGPQVCRPQIRLVWQPVIKKSSNTDQNTNQYTTVDVAVHSFYELDLIDWDEIKTKLKAISQGDILKPLQIHPLLTLERYNGIYWKKLTEIIFQYSSDKNLSQVTSMTLRADRVWAFSGVHLKNNQWVQMEIPTLSRPDQPNAKIINQAFILEPDSLLNLNEFKGSVTLMDVKNKAWFKLLSDSNKFAETQTEDQVIDAVSMAYEFENPKKHNPGTIDCVSCHISQTIRFWGHFKYPIWNNKNIFDNIEYKNDFLNLKNTSVNPQNTNRVRAFGYFDEDPLVSQRVINETAEILKYF